MTVTVKMMSTLHRINDENRMIVKGAVDKSPERQTKSGQKDGIWEITKEDKEKIQRQNQEFSMEGFECWHLPSGNSGRTSA